MNGAPDQASDGASDLVVAAAMPSAAAAKLVADVLRDFGIPAQVSRTALQDESAMGPKAAGLPSFEVQVPRSRLEEAREIIADLEEDRVLATQVPVESPRDLNGTGETQSAEVPAVPSHHPFSGRGHGRSLG